MTSSTPARMPSDDEIINARGAVSNQKLEAMLRKVRALLAQADHPNTTPAEAQTFRAKAEALMFRYRIDESQLAAAGDTSIDVQWSYVDVCNLGNEYRHFYEGIFERVAEHVGCRWHREFADVEVVEEGVRRRAVRMHYVGFPSDIRIADALFTAAQVAFATRLEPKYDPELSEQENAYHMRKAGMEGWRIAEAIWGTRGKMVCCDKRDHWRTCVSCEAGRHDSCELPSYNDSNLYKARRLFKKEALERGEDPSVLLGQGNSMSVYRESYANGFYWELNQRLYHMRQSRGESSTELEIGGRKERIDAAFYERYPQYAPPKAAIGFGPEDDSSDEDEERTYRCPHCEEEVERLVSKCPHCSRSIEWPSGIGRSHARGTYSDPRADCEKCQKAKSGYCRDHAYLRPSTARYRERSHNYAGEAAGRAAARSVDLGGGPRGRLER